MVVLSTAICTKSGKALISRQFVEMTRIRIEGLLAAFPKLMGSDLKQHTFVETESVRYVYQPVDNLYLLLITNRASNIVEDLETLKLLSKVVPNVAGTTNNLTEEKVFEKCFELLFAFDEVITAGGYREQINLQQIKTNMEMESHEEKLHNMIKISKIESAKDQARDAARTIREKQKEQQRAISSGGANSSSGMGSSSFNEQSNTSNAFSDVTAPNPPIIPLFPAARTNKAVSGMQLTGKKNNALEDALVKEDKLAPISITASSKFSASSAVESSASVAYVQPVVQHPVMMIISEKVNAKLTRDGTVEQFEIKGSLTLTAATDDAALCTVQLKPISLHSFSFNTHPKVNKSLYEKSGVLQLKDTTKGFPTARPVGILKWSYVTNSSDEFIPIKINCWPEEEGRGQMNVSIEYSMDLKNFELHGVVIRIPLGTSEVPTILNIDGTHKHNASNNELLWQIDLIDDSNASGSLEFNIAQRFADAFFPISVQFASKQLYCDAEVVGVKNAKSGAPIMYGLSKSMSSEEYVFG